MAIVISIIVIIGVIYLFKNRENQPDTNGKIKPKRIDKCNITVVDNDDVMIKILSLSEDDEKMILHIQAKLKGYHSDTVHFHFSVNSIDSLKANEPKFYEVNDTNINYWHMEIPKEAKSVFGFPSVSFYMTDIALEVLVYTGEPEYAYQNAIFKKKFHMYPYGKDKVRKFVRDIDKSEIAIVDNEKLYLSINYIEEDSQYHSVHISGFFENKTNKELSIRLYDGEINGMAIDLNSTIYNLLSLPAGCSGYFSYYPSQELSDLGLDSIKDIKTLKLKLPKEITARNKTIEINKDMLKFY